jgi:MerR family copper efflux transcriptional regulator
LTFYLGGRFRLEPMGGAGLTIGKVAARSGVGTKAIRFYESVGVIVPPARAANGYRVYSAEAVDLLRFIRQAQGFGLTLDEIREIMTIRRGGRPPCRHVHRLLEEKAGELDRKLADLLMLRRRIRRSLAAWERGRAGQAVVCPHIESPTAVRPSAATTTQPHRRASPGAARRKE